jgi:hypothetical protein
MQNIISLLEQSGATDDLLAIVRADNGIESIAACKLGHEITLNSGDIAEKYRLRQNKQSEQQSTRKNKKNIQKRCSIALFDCTNQGFGADDCMRSIQTCNTSGTGLTNLCCTNEHQKQYFDARCSGLDVLESVKWSAGNQNIW